MTNFSSEQLLKIASLSALKLSEHEVAEFSEQINSVLGYVSELKSVTERDVAELQPHANVFREDKVHSFDASLIAQAAPEVKDSFFVVPKIL